MSDDRFVIDASVAIKWVVDEPGSERERNREDERGEEREPRTLPEQFARTPAVAGTHGLKLPRRFRRTIAGRRCQPVQAS